MPKVSRIAFGIALVALLGAQTRAGTFTGSGLNLETGNTVSGSAVFSVSGSTLEVLLTNSTVGGTLLRGDVLTGISFDILGSSPAMSLTSIALGSPGDSTTDDRIFTSKTVVDNTAPLSGSWTSVLGSSPIGEYGAAATGFAGAFSAAGITRGNGGTDYGIVAAGTFPAPPGAGTSNSFNASAFPLVQDTIKLTFTAAMALVDPTFTNVKFLFGTDGTGVIPGTTPPPAPVVPEPSSVVLALCAALPLGFRAIRRRLRGNA